MFSGWSGIPPHNVYAIWKYAQNIPEGSRPPISELYQVARSKTQYPAGDISQFLNTPHNVNSWIAGYL